MNKVKLLAIISVGLLVSNILIVVLLFNKSDKHPPRHGGPRNIIIEKLHFDETQITEYDQLIQWHRSEIDKNEHQMMALKNQLYSLLKENASSEKKDSLINELSLLQKQIENVHYKHFSDIQKMCKAEQQEAFNSLIEEIAILFSPPHPPGKKPRR
ncbi:MAG: hypothetical protein JNL69_04620 [Bacteroidia bacterium]|nr:hypothetical protein [Bacteroidia bacterium]